MTNITPAAAAARENARTNGGQFGEQQHAEASAGVVRPLPKPEDFHQDFADAVRDADRAANGDSNDDEHDALIDLNAAAEGYLEAHRRAGTLDLDSIVTGPNGQQQPSFHAALKRMVDRTEEVTGDDGSNDDEFDHLNNFKEVVRSHFDLPEDDED
ncbi:hypothetical protein [Curtobacterium sp. MCSS17_016]|uniref:hypothetical protein n=1 Tax=Curtobacterium sp. MCSS17_016 TaxID=2175644 RepID=UPI000DAAAFB1|nr:hypothetical protein [Curtobacterium sp. MCSS17_016]WIE81218.1 hypothetical protein DEJ19_018465 [Curtobacterium sp. MCSS17_016]